MSAEAREGAEPGREDDRPRRGSEAGTGPRDIAQDVRDIWPDYRPTPLLEVPALARLARVGRVLVKMECERPLGNFKALGGMVAGLRALARVAGVPSLRDLRADVSRSGATGDMRASGASLPGLVCASAGNHGLAVAAAARWAGTQATVYLAESANRARAARIEALGARVVWTPGTYDDAVERAASAPGLLIADTSIDPDDQVVKDVMDGYSLIWRELAAQLSELPVHPRGGLTSNAPTHLFVQAGVGGLAAALAQGFQHLASGPRRLLVVEPQSAPCVAAALDAGQPVRVEGALSTQAEMLACGLASAPAVKILCKHDARSVLVTEEQLQQAAAHFASVQSACSPPSDHAAGAALSPLGGPCTTPSGATGLAGLLRVSSSDELRKLHQLDDESCVLLVITEGAPPNTATIFGTS